MGGGLPQPKLRNKCILFFEIVGFQRPLLRYLLKTVLHCKGSRISGNAITEVTLLLHYVAMVGGKVTPNFSYMRDYIPILELGNDVRGALASVVESRGGGNAAACV